MSLSQLMSGGPDCGPSNPLQGLTKTFDQDRSLQQDHFGVGRAGASRQPFRTTISNPQLEDEAARFFAKPSGPGPSFDLSTLSRALPPQAQAQTQAQHQGWAADFFARPASTPLAQANDMRRARFAAVYEQSTPKTVIAPQADFDWAADFLRPQAAPQPVTAPQTFAVQPTYGQSAYSSFRPDFYAEPPPPPTMAMEAPRSMSAPPSTEEQVTASTSEARNAAVDQDDLAATAGLLIDSVRTETNPKFQASAFMGLMRQLRDKTAVVEGNDIVEASASSHDAKGKGRADAWTEEFIASHGGGSADGADFLDRTENVWTNGMLRPGPQGATVPLYSDMLAAADLHEYQPPEHDVFPYDEAWMAAPHETAQRPTTTRRRKSVHFEPESSFDAQTREWDQLQDDWDTFEAAQESIRPVSTYRFQEQNPFLNEHTTTRHHSMHSNYEAELWRGYETVLEKEAAVQRDPTNASAWYELGVKQQENEREHKAIQALRRAVELDPDHLDAWLALAVSSVNENNRRAAYDAIESWVEKNPRYKDVVKPAAVAGNAQTASQRVQTLMDQLIAMARSAPADQIDADVQVALGVLFNTNEEYGRAIDCFHAALAARPDDWQLYNRVGASLANSGEATRAIEYYLRALELNPSYIRARYNMGISAINLKRYGEAAQHILDALVLQESEANNMRDLSDDRKGVMSSALWDTLRSTSMNLQRPDLAALCEQQDLEAFRAKFSPGLDERLRA